MNIGIFVAKNRWTKAVECGITSSMSKGVRACKGLMLFWQAVSLVFVLAAANLLSGCKSHPEEKKAYPHEAQEREEAWPEQGGPDAPAPYRAGKEPESARVSADSTPVPPSNRPIDRPLDPTGLPVSSPTP
jgi:hypothetical protein